MDPHVAGKDLLHLQCHFGMDTLTFARLGARVTGADFSERAIEQARLLRYHYWQHSMGEIVTSLAAAGLRIEYLTNSPGSPGRCTRTWSRPSPAPGGCPSRTTAGCR